MIRWLFLIILFSNPLHMVNNAGSEDVETPSTTSSHEILQTLLQDVQAAKDTASMTKTSASKPKKKAVKRPNGFQQKDVMIERNIKFQLKHDPNLPREEAKHRAAKRYDTYLDAQRLKSRLRSQKHKDVKNFVKSIDPTLAKLVTRDPPTKKIHFIARKEEQIKREHVGIQHGVASKMAHKLYDKFAQDRIKRQARYREAKKQKRRQSGEKKQ